MPNVLVIRLPVEEVDRLTLRQVLNKLHGEHDFLLDSEEFLAIKELGGLDDLQFFLGLHDDKLAKYLNPTEDEVPFADKFEIIIECPTIKYQEEKFNKLTEEGYKCRLLSL